MFEGIVRGPGPRKRAGIGVSLLLAASLVACTPAGAPSVSAAPETTVAVAPSPVTPATSASPSPSATKAVAQSVDPSCPGDECIEVAVAGDILLHPALWDQAEQDGKGKYDFGPLLAAIAPYLAESDLALCNLETPVAAPGGPFGGYPMFNVPPQIIPALKKVGYDGCTTASNHSMDAGVAGVKRTLEALDAAGKYKQGLAEGAPLLAEVGVGPNWEQAH